jgi:hypothetical protein
MPIKTGKARCTANPECKAITFELSEDPSRNVPFDDDTVATVFFKVGHSSESY